MKSIKFNYLVRNVDADDHLENFLISAITSIFIIRSFLTFTNYPQIGSGTFHISHMLWGGFLMMLSVIGLLIFLNREIKVVAATLGGIGFGTFIDELGKFITSDNNYFFQPTIALIYVIFILLYLFYKLFSKHFKVSQKEYAVNALEMIKDAVLHNLDIEEKRKAEEYLKNSNPRDPVVKVLKATIARIDTIPSKKRSLIVKLRVLMRNYYLKLIKNPLFSRLVISFFITLTILSIFVYALGIIFDRSFAQWGLLLSTSFSGIFVLLGIYFFKKDKRLTAYEMFKFAILISIFLTQFFKFFKEQLSAITGLAISIIIWNVLQNLIHQEILIKENAKLKKLIK